MNKKEEIYWSIKEIIENLQINQGGFIKLGSLEVRLSELGFWGVNHIKYCGKDMCDVTKLEIVFDAEDRSFKLLIKRMDNEDIHIENTLELVDND